MIRSSFEIQRTTAPRTTRSIHAALDALARGQVDLIHAAEHTFPLKERIRAVAFSRIRQDVEALVRPTG